jgi:hypothetical protein
LLPADGKAEFETFEKQLATFDSEMAKSGIDLSLGLVLAKRKGGESMLVYGAAKSDALPILLQTLGVDDGPKAGECRTLTEVAGYSVCAESKVEGYAPGSSAAVLRARAQKALPGFELDRANILALLQGDGEELAVAVETGQGMAHLAVAAPSLRTQLADKLAVGPAPALGLVGPGKPFVWARMAKSLLAESTRGAPAVAATAAGTLTGEMMLGGLAGRPGYVVAVGLDDPAPISGLASLASLGFSEVPKTLPDGTALELELASIKAAGATVPTIKGRFTSGPAMDLTKTFGYEPAFFAFAAGKYGAATYGAGEDVVPAIAEYTAAAPTEDQLAALPAPLRRELLAGKVAAAMYLPLDAMHAPTAAEVYKAILDRVPAAERPPVDVSEAIAAGTALFAPLSSFSGWLSDVDTTPILHFTVEGFFAPGTPEGAAAIAAMTAVVRGADAKATYGALAKEYASSPYVHRYKTRAGETGHAVDSLIAIGAVGAALAGAFAYGMARSMGASPPPAVAVPADPSGW